MNRRTVIELGTSITGSGPGKWSRLLNTNLPTDAPTYGFIGLYQAGVSSTTAWNALIRLQTDVLDKLDPVASQGRNVVLVEFSAQTDAREKHQEAIIRRILGYQANVRVMLAHFGRYEDINSGYTLSSVGQTALTNDTNLSTHYGITLANAHQNYADLVDAETYTMTELYTDNVHPNNDPGHVEAENYIAPLVVTEIAEGDYGALPDRLTDCSIYEVTPIIRLGTDNDGETGTGWSTSGTARQSSTANDTISWIGTFASFGLDALSGVTAGTLAWSIDGGSYTNIDMSVLEVDIVEAIWDAGASGAHTVTIKVVSGLVKINRFLAI